MKKHVNNSSHRWLWPAIVSVSVIIFSIAAAVIVWSINKNREENPTKNDQVVMIVTSRGGLCPDERCNPRYSLYEDGKFENHQNLTKAEVAKIKEIASKPSFSMMTVPEQNQQCNSFTDGQDTVLIFPNIHGNRQFVPCEMTTEIDGSDLDYILSLISSSNYNLEQIN